MNRNPRFQSPVLQVLAMSAIMLAQAFGAERKVEHRWTFAAAQFVVEKGDRAEIMRDSGRWLKDNGFRLVTSFEKLNLGAKEDFDSAIWYQKSFKEKGRLVIELNPGGSANLIVVSYQKLPENARFRAGSIEEYRKFALWMDRHEKQMIGSDSVAINKAIDAKIARLLAKETKATALE